MAVKKFEFGGEIVWRPAPDLIALSCIQLQAAPERPWGLHIWHANAWVTITSAQRFPAFISARSMTQAQSNP